MANSDLLNINPNRDVIIISHPRSGSTWLQSCLPQVNCFEPFSKFITINFHGDHVKCTLLKEPMQYSESEFVAMMQDRIQEMSGLTKPKSVKIHSFYLNRPDMMEWINAQDATVVFLERRDKFKAFKSLLIAYSLHAYIGHIPKSSVTVDMNMVGELYKRVNDQNLELNKNKLKHQIQTVYYEDLILENKLVSHNPPAVKQNTTDVVIENWEQVHDFMLQNNLI
jgi:Sulfotransferase domain